LNPLLIAAAACQLVLVGDSTMGFGTGYGPALCVQVAGTCVDAAVGGAGATSFRDRGYWTRAVRVIRKNTVVLIQFGHNDRWDKRPNSAALFEQAIERYIHEARALGATPIVVTPLSERRFAHGALEDDLAPWGDRATIVAHRMSVPVLALHADSAAEIKRLGPQRSMQLAQVPPTQQQLRAATSGDSPALPAFVPGLQQFDYTHLGPRGAQLAARLVRQEMTAIGLGKCFKPH
jgi:lysophospholipase L1-like esterase